MQLQQILMNLMLNGIEAMKDSGGVCHLPPPFTFPAYYSEASLFLASPQPAETHPVLVAATPTDRICGRFTRTGRALA
jgi:hypothetical protein